MWDENGGKEETERVTEMKRKWEREWEKERERVTQNEDGAPEKHSGNEEIVDEQW